MTTFSALKKTPFAALAARGLSSSARAHVVKPPPPPPVSSGRAAVFPTVVAALVVATMYIAYNNKNDNFDYWRRMQEGGDIWPMFNPESGMKDPRPPAGPKRN